MDIPRVANVNVNVNVKVSVFVCMYFMRAVTHAHAHAYAHSHTATTTTTTTTGPVNVRHFIKRMISLNKHRVRSNVDMVMDVADNVPAVVTTDEIRYDE